MKKIVLCGVTLGLLSACVGDPELYRVGTQNGEAIYKIDVQGNAAGPYPEFTANWAKQMCPQGYRVVGSEMDMIRTSMPRVDYWHKVTLACPLPA